MVLTLDPRASHKQHTCSTAGSTPFQVYTPTSIDPKWRHRDSLISKTFFWPHHSFCLHLLRRLFGMHLASVYGYTIHLVCSCLASLTSLQASWVHVCLSSWSEHSAWHKEGTQWLSVEGRGLPLVGRCARGVYNFFLFFCLWSYQLWSGLTTDVHLQIIPGKAWGTVWGGRDGT